LPASRVSRTIPPKSAVPPTAKHLLVEMHVTAVRDDGALAEVPAEYSSTKREDVDGLAEAPGTSAPSATAVQAKTVSPRGARRAPCVENCERTAQG